MTETPIAQKTNALDPYPTPMFIAMEKDQERKKKIITDFMREKKKKKFPRRYRRQENIHTLSSVHTAENARPAQEPQGSKEAEEAQCCRGPQNDLEEVRCPRRRGVLAKSVSSVQEQR